MYECVEETEESTVATYTEKKIKTEVLITL